MEWNVYLFGIIDTAIYCVIGIIMMGIGFCIVMLVSPFSVKKEIEDDQNVALGIIIGAVIIGLSIIIGSVISAPGSGGHTSKPVDKKAVEEKAGK
ncbi:MAG: DUF350 domain-containing protein [Spirochaetes bacterium]|jgi:uncharacterized membrane protein YjfL (UPF0719 family)|nr:DUF350 domain-containing protein [Spirochaetota bacterium]